MPPENGALRIGNAFEAPFVLDLIGSASVGDRPPPCQYEMRAARNDLMPSAVVYPHATTRPQSPSSRFDRCADCEPECRRRKKSVAGAAIRNPRHFDRSRGSCGPGAAAHARARALHRDAAATWTDSHRSGACGRARVAEAHLDGRAAAAHSSARRFDPARSGGARRISRTRRRSPGHADREFDRIRTGARGRRVAPPGARGRSLRKQSQGNAAEARFVFREEPQQFRSSACIQ